jgi:hypothetical protein
MGTRRRGGGGFRGWSLEVRKEEEFPLLVLV